MPYQLKYNENINTSNVLSIIIILLIFYIIYHFANCPLYQYSHSSKIIPSKMSSKIISSKMKPEIKTTLLRPRCDIYQSNSENYSPCINNLVNFIDDGYNTYQFSST